MAAAGQAFGLARLRPVLSLRICYTICVAYFITLTSGGDFFWMVADGGPGAEPLVRGSGGVAPPEAEKKLNLDNRAYKPPLILHLSKHFGVSQRSVWWPEN